MSELKESCKYCTPTMTIRNTVFFEHIPIGRGSLDYGGEFGIIAVNGDYFLRYENTADVFFNEVCIDERRSITHCPMCGRRLGVEE